ncbi:hypothetical protein HYH02_009132 [Chlamydomonas schloesseri]|uniref:Uncharacterized protein n=1 Tax=Chlamydomonas schloesseri TaxID=2026947 RepID=A0A835WB81_9CHLO|nr:hypothetical protein HYH02_009132 [Chlamydomonas schloesseri]|eukprot:KAG2444194.1 hypothetical protein HYH02_009132 [Chlamydomonas schloesseri]
MAGSARNLQGLLRRTLAGEAGNAITQAGSRGFAAEAKQFTADGKYMPGIFSKAKPLDRSTQWVHKNPYIEAWYYRRDHFEKEFVWNYRNTVEAVWFLGGFTMAAYALSVFAFRQSDRRSGYPKRQILGDEPAMVLPDERQFY